MPNCWSIDQLITPYVDGELAPADRQTVEQHTRACTPCRARVATEQAVRDLVRACKPALTAPAAPPELRARCAAVGRTPGVPRVAGLFAGPWRARLGPLALAATLAVIVGGAFLYPLTEPSTRVMAAELTIDHMKCFLLNAALGTHDTEAAVTGALADDFDWQAQLPGQPGQAGLELVGERTCLYGKGRIAHVMYRHEGRAVSVFMLPDDVRQDGIVSIFGHNAAIWTVGHRTFVLVAREPREEIERMASFVRASLR
jgi:anti-sigma factor (TIGR02949 family)